jgi:16S rRNA processing protein RimM
VHGVSGGIKVKATSGDPSGLLAVRFLVLRGEPLRGATISREYEVRTARRAGGCAVFTLKGVESAEAAGELVGARVSVRREELPQPGEGEYFVSDLVGCEVAALDGASIGRVSAVVNGPAHDWLEIRRDGGGDALLPAVSEFVKEVDVAGRRIVVAPPEGWPDAD